MSLARRCGVQQPLTRLYHQPGPRAANTDRSREGNRRDRREHRRFPPTMDWAWVEFPERKPLRALRARPAWREFRRRFPFRPDALLPGARLATAARGGLWPDILETRLPSALRICGL